MEDRVVTRAINSEALPPTDIEIRYGFRAFLVNKIAKFARLVVICATTICVVGVLGWTVVQTSRALGGKSTDANVHADVSLHADATATAKVDGKVEVKSEALDQLGKVLASNLTVWILAGLCATVGVGYGLRCRHRWKDSIRHLAPFRRKYEALLDPRRSTTDLTERGDARQED